jgi:hypothetical protein
MSEKGQKRKCPGSRGTSALPSGADIVSLPRHCPFGAKSGGHSMTLSARAKESWK